MNELSGIERDEREDRIAAQQEKRLQQKRFTAALRFATTHGKSDDFFMEIEEAIALADVLIAKLEEPTLIKEERSNG